ncbi:MAG: transketolase, partial [Clostridia bacterium]|nr:transketolase [Clostridia bacterium]
MTNTANYERLSADIRIQTIRALQKAGFGHIGGSMSVADVLAVLYGGAMRI